MKKKTSKCLICGNEFTRFLSRFLNGRGKYCSVKCKYVALSLKHAYIRNCLNCGKEFYPSKYDVNNGHGNYCSRGCFAFSQRGKNGSNWQGGITTNSRKDRNSIELKLWRGAVFARDNWICQECGQYGCKLQAHHIKSFSQYPELRFAIDNGKTLCVDCHKKTPTYAGRAKGVANINR